MRIEMPDEPDMTPATTLLAAQQVNYHYGEQQVLHDISVTVAAGSMVGIIGPNGAGKSSLLKLLAGLLIPSHGQLRLHERDLQQYRKPELARLISYLAQGAPVHWPLQAQRVVELGRLPHTGVADALSDADRQAVADAMLRADVTAFADRAVTELSEGERMRVMIARMFATQAQLMLADEPTAALDLYHQHHTLALFQQHCRHGGSAVLVLHDLNLAARYCDQLLLLDQGRLVCSGTPAQVLTTARLQSVYRMTLRIQPVDGVLQVLVAAP
ncbi:ATP-binding cassette domain-containing protein [Permianibacter sp. IMCC34836]|uniref:ABC transporter ATP-binding protein n=1 Tax=Permianibacter fluminis TaxID=2738515 RepID=UPI001552F65C|nr:ATP-binding cassette domain-containing protein [Permianibacter fluminis]NQD38570.1 ATP-binding cassette domain-containing protein [Permianibacter fluminis]